MFFRKKKEIPIYQNEYFSFEYPAYMRQAQKEEGIISFFKKKPTGIIRMSYYEIEPGMAETTAKEWFDYATDRAFFDPERIEFGGFKGVKWYKKSLNNPLIDGLYWPKGGVHPLFDKKLPNDPIQFALTASAMSYMAMHFWQIVNNHVAIEFNYRTYDTHTKEFKQKADEEFLLIEECIKKIKSLK